MSYAPHLDVSLAYTVEQIGLHSLERQLPMAHKTGQQCIARSLLDKQQRRLRNDYSCRILDGDRGGLAKQHPNPGTLRPSSAKYKVRILTKGAHVYPQTGSVKILQQGTHAQPKFQQYIFGRGSVEGGLLVKKGKGLKE